MPVAVGIGNKPGYSSHWMTRVICLLVIGTYGWVAFSVRSITEDRRSHAVRVSLPLLLGYSWIATPGENYDPAEAKWGSLSTAVGVADGRIVFVRTHQGEYALRLSNQTLEPEQAKYEFVTIGEKGLVHEGIVDGLHPIALPGRRITWSAAQTGHGFLYTSELFVFGFKNPFEFGGPFRDGDIQQFQNGLPPGVQFSSLAWKVNDMNGVKFDEQGFMQ